MDIHLHVCKLQLICDSEPSVNSIKMLLIFLRVTNRGRHSSLPRVPCRTLAEIFGRWLFREIVELLSCCVKHRRMERYLQCDWSHNLCLSTHLTKHNQQFSLFITIFIPGSLCSVLALCWWWQQGIWWTYCWSSRGSEIPRVHWKDTINYRKGNTTMPGSLLVQFLVHECCLICWYSLVNNPYRSLVIVINLLMYHSPKCDVSILTQLISIWGGFNTNSL